MPLDNHNYSLSLFRERLVRWSSQPPVIHPTVNIKKLQQAAVALHKHIRADNQSTTAVGVTEMGKYYVVTPKPGKMTPKKASKIISHILSVAIAIEDITIFKFVSSKYHAEIKIYVKASVSDKVIAIAASQACCVYCSGFLKYMSIAHPSTPGKLPLFAWRHPNSDYGFEPLGTEMKEESAVEKEHHLKGIRVPSPSKSHHFPIVKAAVRLVEDVQKICQKIILMRVRKSQYDFAISMSKSISDLAILIEEAAIEHKESETITPLFEAMNAYQEEIIFLFDKVSKINTASISANTPRRKPSFFLASPVSLTMKDDPIERSPVRSTLGSIENSPLLRTPKKHLSPSHGKENRAESGQVSRKLDFDDINVEHPSAGSPSEISLTPRKALKAS